jgi:hypothetical protein
MKNHAMAAALSVALIVGAQSPHSENHHKLRNVVFERKIVLKKKAGKALVNSVPWAVEKWDTRKTDRMASWPDKSDPMWKQTLRVQEVFACIRYNESRNHLVDGYNQQGWYQFTPYIWWYATTAIKGLPPTPNQATGDQQSSVALFYYDRNGSWSVEWAVDWRCWL